MRRRIWIFWIILFLLSTSRLWGESSILVDTSTGRITVKATREQLGEIEEMLPQFPIETRQVQIKARILELSEEAVRKFGIHLERLTGVMVPVETAGEGTGLKYGPETLAEIGEEGKGALFFTFYRLLAGEEKFEAILNMLIATGEARALSAPQVTTLSGEVAGIYVTEDVPYVSGVTTVDETQVPIYSYITLGVILQVLPKIVGTDLVQMSVIPVVSSYEIKAEFGPQRPVFKRQVSPTNITVKSGEPLIISGLLREEETERLTRFPILSDFPILGHLFKSRIKTMEKRNLFITIKPHILKAREIRGRMKRVFCFKYALSEEVAGQIKDNLSPEGVIEVNPKEAPPNSILIRDIEDRVEVIQNILNRIGVFEQQRREKIFPLVYTSVQNAREVILPLLSSRGSIEIDEEANSLIIEDGAYQLAKIEKTLFSLEKFNQTPRRKVFHLKYARESEVVPLLKKFLSPQGSIEIEEDSIVVTDNNWVIQRLKEEIEKIDTFEAQKKTKSYPLKYVKAEKLLQGEEFKKTFSSFLCREAAIEVKPEENSLIITALKWSFHEIDKMVVSFDIYQPQKMTYELKYSLVSLMTKELESLLSDKGEFEANQERNCFFIVDSQYRLELIQKKLTELDTFEKEKKKERISLKYISLSEIIELVQRLKSSQAKILEKDEDKNKLILEEASYPLEKIKKEIAKRDTFNKQERIYVLRYVEATKVASVIRPFLSDKGEVHIKEDKILVIDSPYYQNKIKKIMGVLDVYVPEK